MTRRQNVRSDQSHIGVLNLQVSRLMIDTSILKRHLLRNILFYYSIFNINWS